MKKSINFFMIVFVLTMLVACGKQERNGIETSSNEETTTIDEIETTSAQEETTTYYGIIPNSAGIVISETTPELEEQTEMLPEELRGIGCGLAIPQKTDEDMKKLGVSKKLVLQTSTMCTYNLDPDIVSRLNELLVTKYDCDFVVEFIGFDDLDTRKYGYDYYDIFSDIREMNQQIDIMMAVSPGHYTKLVKENFFVDITEYLTTDEGKKLYEAYSEEVWEMIEVEGKIYGYFPSSIPSTTYALFCNKELAQELGINIKKGFSFYDIEEALNKADLSGKSDNIVLMYVNGGYLYRMLGYFDMGRGILAKKDTNGNWIAFNATEDEAFINLCKKMREYNEKNWLATNDLSYTKVTYGEFMFAIKPCNSLEMYGDKVFMRTNDRNANRVVYDVIPGEICYECYNPQESYVYGVTSWSEYQSEALKLMTLLSTEEELANLLRYGIADKHYTYRDRKVINLPSEFRTIGSYVPLVNPNITLPQYLEPDNKTETYKEISSYYESSPLIDCDISWEEFQEILKTYDTNMVLYQIYNQGYEKLLGGQYKDVDAAIAEINRMQKDAGIDKLIEAFNNEFKIDAE